ncbi:MAG TPA: chromate resistance protein ChrB domain-containing protein [Terriglobales bacterium]|nr:chromate resistance protein ChrB domain-containing protein [Terriglobales bacterium]
MAVPNAKQAPSPTREPADTDAPWLLLVFSLPSSQASKRVEVWRKLKQYGALPLPSSGYLLPNTPLNHEHFEWLATAIRKYKGQAAVVKVSAIGDESPAHIRQRFVEARSHEYEQLLKELRKKSRKRTSGELARLRRHYQQIASIDFFDSPLRSRVESLLNNADGLSQPSSGASSRKRKEFLNRTWITRPRPGIDRVSSAWLICKFIDAHARFAFTADPRNAPNAVPFDMFQPGGFGHRGEDCTFETLRKEFGIRDSKVAVIAQIIHDADLEDGKYGRSEGIGVDRVLIGWAHEGTADEELLRRGIGMIEGLYQSLT